MSITMQLNHIFENLENLNIWTSQHLLCTIMEDNLGNESMKINVFSAQETSRLDCCGEQISY